MCRTDKVKPCRQMQFVNPVCEDIRVHISVSPHHCSTCTMTHVTHSSFHSSCQTVFFSFFNSSEAKYDRVTGGPDVQWPSQHMTHYPEQPAWSSLLFHEISSKAFAAGLSLVSVTDSHCSSEVSGNMSRPAGPLQAELPCKCHTCCRQEASVCFK